MGVILIALNPGHSFCYWDTTFGGRDINDLTKYDVISAWMGQMTNGLTSQIEFFGHGLLAPYWHQSLSRIVYEISHTLASARNNSQPVQDR